MKRKILALASILALIGVMVGPGAAFAANDGLTGDFQIASDTPTATVTLYESTGTIPATSMTPQTEYSVKVYVSDANGLADLKNIVLKLWYDSDAGTPTEVEFDAVGTTGNAQTSLIITWTEGGTFVLTGPTSTTWTLGTCSAPASLPGNFEFKFTVGKVAKATGAPDNWQIGAKVTDDTSPVPLTVFAYDTDTSTNDMNWYGEITVTAPTVSWGTVSLGMDFGEDTASEENVGNITYICNGAYNKKVSTTSAWSTTAILDEDGGTLAANNFSLMADNDDGLTDAVYVTVAGGTIGTGTITSETGYADSANGLWLKLASVFAQGTFSGTITYTISQ